jgi:hypothetical protein
MKTALALAFFCTQALAAPPELFVRGGFNGWGIDNPLVDKGNGVYEASLQVPPGYHGFKIGSRDWSAEWVVDPQTPKRVEPGRDYRLHMQPGAEGYLFAKEMAVYTFRLDTSKATPGLSIARGPTVVAPVVNPHTGKPVEWRFPTWDGKSEAAAFSADNAILRGYTHSTTLQLRDPGPQYVRYAEQAGMPRVRSGNLAFDALFALALHEMKQASVSQIADGNYNGGKPVACDCFETGEKWHYVWTRDLSYAAHLGLALLDPQRVRNSLDFKLSGYRSGVQPGPHVPTPGAGLQIIQDTGSGGSWPVSTDRVSWAFGAEAALNGLPPDERKTFAPRALAALRNTIEIDRVAAFDDVSGLYTGEQSFLDWREQSYASWITEDIASLAAARALSTNVAHYKAITLAAQLAAEQGDQNLATRYADWATDLKESINRELWLDQAGMYSSLTAGHFDGTPMPKFDWLGQSLAILTGVTNPHQARSILARYPHGPLGPPVIYPQQQGVPVYHNRAMWPFVTAYGLKAAAMAGNASVADAAYQSLMRGAALNLSNMENLEWLSGQPLLLDEANPSMIGPVINSRRQLWSVGGYIGMVLENVFGVQAGAEGLRIQPFITTALRSKTFGQSFALSLRDLNLQRKNIAVTIRLPAISDRHGHYPVSAIQLNGRQVASPIPWDQLGPDNTIDVTLGQVQESRPAITLVNANPYKEDPAVFAPKEPELAKDGTGLRVGGSGAGVSYNIYRDGALVASGLKAGQWSDRKRSALSCYAAEAVYPSSGNHSHHSKPLCLGAVTELPSLGSKLRMARGGNVHIQLKYHNAANQINLGISNGVKWLAIRDAKGKVVEQGVIQMPHVKMGQAPAYSTPLAATLRAGSYTLELSDFYNMSYLQSNASFSAAGGVAGASNTFKLHGVRVTPVK